MTASFSSYSVLLDEKDLKGLPKNQYPIVIAYNGRDHFVPTIPASEEDYCAWKINKEFGSLCAATQLVAKECDRPQVPAEILKPIREIEKVIEKSLPKFSKFAQKTFVSLTRKSSLHRGPAVKPTSSVSVAPGSSSSQPGPDPSTSGAPADPWAVEEEEVQSSGTAKGYKCEHCGVVKQRKPDLRGHLWQKHKLGDPIVCNLGECDNKSFSHPSSLKQHIRIQHSGDFKFECDICSYKTDSGSNLTSHLYLKHKILEKDERGKAVVYKCKYCQKEFAAKHLATKHMKDRLCITKKKHKCPHCPRKYKTVSGLEYHKEHYHEGKKSPCPKCGLLIAAKSMRNHLRRHSSQQLLQAARTFHSKVVQRQRYFAYTSRRLAKRATKAKEKDTPVVSRSAPAKLRKGRSPRCGSPRKSPRTTQ